MSENDRVVDRSERKFPPAEKLFYLFGSKGTEGVTVTLSGGESYSVQAISIDWKDIVIPEILDIERDDLRDSLGKAGLDQSHIFFYIMSPEFPDSDDVAFEPRYYSDEPTVGFLEQIEEEKGWDFGGHRVMPDELRRAVEESLDQVKIPDAESLFHLFNAARKGEVIITLAGGEMFEVNMYYQDWEDFILNLIDMSADDLEERIEKLGLSDDFAFYFIVTPIPTSQEKVGNFYLCSDAPTVELIDELEGKYDFHFGGYQVMSDEIVQALEDTLGEFID